MSEAPAPAKITAADVRAGLLKSFGGESTNGRYAVLFEVSNATATARSRSADAVIMSCWPSDGLELHGVEIKVARADWMSELRNPKKAEDISKFCDRWWLVTAPGVVRDESEIPPAWGWRVWDGKALRTMKKADRTPAEPVNRSFLASVLRNAGRLSAGAIEAAKREVRDQVEAEVEHRVKKQLEARTGDKVGRLLEEVSAFEAATGITLAEQETWGYLTVANGSRVGAMVKALADSGLDGTSWKVGSFKQLLGQLEATREAVTAAAAALGCEMPELKKGRSR